MLRSKAMFNLNFIKRTYVFFIYSLALILLNCMLYLRILFLNMNKQYIKTKFYYKISSK